MYPSGSLLYRVCTKPYKIPDTEITIQEGDILFIAAHAIHRDPEHFPNPSVFDPERFQPEEVKKRHPFAFLPFGEGPRFCIGLRLAMMEIKIALAYLLKNFKLTPNERTKLPLNFNAFSIFITTVDPIYINSEFVA